MRRTTLALVLLMGVSFALLLARPSSQVIYDRAATVRQSRAPSWVAEKTRQLPLTTPRTPWGEPDFRGSWGTEDVTSDAIERIDDWLDSATPPTETFIVDPADGKVPYQPWALAERTRMRAGLSRGWPGESGPPLHMDPRVTVTDPTVFTQPWTMNLPIRKRAPEEIWEHACHEGNAYLLEGVKSHGFRWFGGVTPPAPSQR